MEYELWDLYGRGFDDYIPIRINLKEIDDYDELVSEFIRQFSKDPEFFKVLQELSFENKFVIFLDQYEAYNSLDNILERNQFEKNWGP